MRLTELVLVVDERLLGGLNEEKIAVCFNRKTGLKLIEKYLRTYMCAVQPEREPKLDEIR
jgi:hypothetical protein